MPSTVSRKTIVGGLLPFVSALVGIGLKFAFIDKFDAKTTLVSAYLVEVYLRPAWVDLIVLAYVSGFASMAARKQNFSSEDLWIYLGLPALSFVVCVVMVVGTQKAGLESNMLQIYLPGLITAFSLAMTGARSVQ